MFDKKERWIKQRQVHFPHWSHPCGSFLVRKRNRDTKLNQIRRSYFPIHLGESRPVSLALLSPPYTPILPHHTAPNPSKDTNATTSPSKLFWRGSYLLVYLFSHQRCIPPSSFFVFSAPLSYFHLVNINAIFLLLFFFLSLIYTFRTVTRGKRYICCWLFLNSPASDILRQR